MESTKSKVRRAARRGLTQREIAAELGLSRIRIRKCLEGWTNPTPRQAEPGPEIQLEGWNEDPLG